MEVLAPGYPWYVTELLPLKLLEHLSEGIHEIGKFWSCLDPVSETWGKSVCSVASLLHYKPTRRQQETLSCCYQAGDKMPTQNS